MPETDEPLAQEVDKGAFVEDHERLFSSLPLRLASLAQGIRLSLKKAAMVVEWRE